MNTSALHRLREWMVSQGFPRFFVIRPENFAWLTGGGDNAVVMGEAVGWLEIEDKVQLHTSQIEAARLAAEEAGGIEVVVHPWYAVPHPETPNDLEHDLTLLRLVLSQSEQQRFRTLGRETAEALGEVVWTARPEWTERELSGAVSEALYSKEIQPVVLLTAGEERVFKYRHPLPKGCRLGKLCMVVVCGRRKGLVVNLTRMRSWGHSAARSLYRLVLRVEATALETSRPGATLAEVLESIKQAYTRINRMEAFLEHHQGGVAGYRPREVLAVPEEKMRLDIGMCLAWNPSLAGVKVEDTFLLTSAGLVNLSFDPRWPTVKIEGRERPALLEDV